MDIDTDTLVGCLCRFVKKMVSRCVYFLIFLRFMVFSSLLISVERRKEDGGHHEGV